jgi:hypothetical protein
VFEIELVVSLNGIVKESVCASSLPYEPVVVTACGVVVSVVLSMAHVFVASDAFRLASSV